MRRALLLLLLLWPALALAEPGTVIVISWDGVRFDDPERVGLPGLARMAREGARAERLIPPFPSATFPSHVSLATGTWPDVHGIVANRFRDPQLGVFDYSDDTRFLRAEPLWIAAERQGVRAATYFWVGSEQPWHGMAATYRMRPFSRAVPEREKIRQLLAWLALPEAERPHLIMTWWRGADREGHLHGPGSPEVDDALRAQDAELTYLLAELDALQRWDEITLIVVSDHGMTRATHAIDLEDRLSETGLEGIVEVSAAVGHVYLSQPEEAEQALEALGSHPDVQAYLPSTLPESLRFDAGPRVGDVVCITDPPNTFRAGFGNRMARRVGQGTGAHGYRTHHEAVHGIWFALGRGVAPGLRLGSLLAIDLAPTVSALLGIDPPAQNEGRVIQLEKPPEGLYERPQDRPSGGVAGNLP